MKEKNGVCTRGFKKPRKWSVANCCLGSWEGGRSVPGSRPSLFQVYLVENFTLKRVLHGTFGSCQMLPPGRRLTALWTSREKPSKSEAPCLWVCGLTGGNVMGCASLRAPAGFRVYESELTACMERSIWIHFPNCWLKNGLEWAFKRKVSLHYLSSGRIPRKLVAVVASREGKSPFVSCRRGQVKCSS